VRRRATPFIVIAVAALTALIFVVAVRSPGPKAQHAPPAKPAATAADVHVARTSLGRILVNSSGHTLYLFREDHGGKSTCYGACARVWPPAIVAHAPRPGSGVEASKLTTTLRANDARQLVYNGHPLYAMVADARPGQTQGQGFLGTWFVVSPTGHQIGHARGPSEY
jgi:predicted lipoprotein with Yx(FWY)xxD motif